MGRIKWYGPTLVLLVTVLVVMIAGPRLTQNLAHAHKTAEIELIQQSLEGSSTLAQMSEAFRNVAKVVEPSVVYIEVSHQYQGRTGPSDDMRRRFEQFFGPQFRQQPDEDDRPNRSDEDVERYNSLQPIGAGSGWVLDEEGHIVTNNHVVTLRDQTTVADQIKIKFYDGSERIAKVVGTDPKTDTAVLKVDGPVVPASTARVDVEQGDIVFAFGSPLSFQFSMSQGVISATGRTNVGILKNSRQQGYENFIQTDAAINPGNSGGPLTNIRGEVVGMNTAIASRTGQFAGIGLAIPVEDVLFVVNQLIDKGAVDRGMLGIAIKDLDPRMAQTFGFEGKGVLVESAMDNTPAKEAGLQSGDIVTAINGEMFDTADQLRNFVSRHPAGTVLKVEYFRDGKTHKVDIELAKLRDPVAMRNGLGGGDESEPSKDEYELLHKFGIERVVTMSDALAARYRIDFTEGVLVLDARRGSAADAAGLDRGAIIVSVMKQKVTSVKDLITELAKHDPTKPIRVRISMNGRMVYTLLQLPEE